MGLTAGLALSGAPAAASPSSGTDNTRTGTDNLRAPGADTSRRAVPPARQAPERTTTADTAAATARLRALNLMEIEAGRLAQQKGHAQAVRSYGGRLLREHQAADAQVVSYAKRRGVDLSAQVAAIHQSDPEHAKMQAAMQRVAGLSGAEFDREFLKVMEEGHRKAIEFASSARASAADPQLKALLAELLPGLEKHHQMAVRLMDPSPGTAATTTETAEPPRHPQGP